MLLFGRNLLVSRVFEGELLRQLGVRRYLLLVPCNRSHEARVNGPM